MTQPTYVLPAPEVTFGEIADPDDYNGVAAWVDYLSQIIRAPLAAVVSASGTLSVPNGPGTGTGSWNAGRTYVPFDTVEYDPTGMVDLGGGGGHANQTVNVLQPGLYIPFSSGAWGNNGTGFRTLSVDLSGDAALAIAVAQMPPVAGSIPTVQQVSGFKVLSGGAFVGLRADQNSGGALNLSGGRLALFRAALSS